MKAAKACRISTSDATSAYIDYLRLVQYSNGLFSGKVLAHSNTSFPVAGTELEAGSHHQFFLISRDKRNMLDELYVSGSLVSDPSLVLGHFSTLKLAVFSAFPGYVSRPERFTDIHTTNIQKAEKYYSYCSRRLATGKVQMYLSIFQK